MKKKKLLTSCIAVALSAALLFGGTFAWQSISQKALNEVSGTVNPGGRLHDDFNEISGTVETGDNGLLTMAFDKDVYVENFTEYTKNGVQVFARVRLDEYMEMGKGAGVLNEDGTASELNEATPLVEGTKLEDKATWSTYKFGEDSEYRDYWEMNVDGGKTVYMPTFNKNKDSLEADINGTSAAEFNDHVDYEVGDVSGEKDSQIYAIYDIDTAESGKEESDELALEGIKADTVVKNGANALLDMDNWNEHIEIQQETHTAKETLSSFIIPMSKYLECLEAGEMDGNNFDGTGEFWVYDEDGWAYWASPIDPETATGLLLDSINRTEAIINQDWYYAINVVAQFITYDDMGQDNSTGFYDLSEGCAPSASALTLLDTIGVEVGSDVSTADELVEALSEGGVVALKEDIVITEPLTIEKNTVLNLNEHSISISEDGNDIFDDSVENGDWSLISVRGEGVTLTINGDSDKASLKAKENDSFCVDVRDGAKVIINGGYFYGNMDCVYVLKGEAVINGGQFLVQQPSGVAGKEYNYVLNCNNENYANGTAKIIVNGGSFMEFDPSSETAGDDGCFVSEGHEVEVTTFGGHTRYDVIESVSADETIGA